MCTNPEKRECARFHHETPVAIEECDSGSFYEARMFNYSLQGMYFESDLSLLPGDRVNIWISGSPEDAVPEIQEAEVRWCEEITGAVVLYNYGCGIKYSRSADQEALSRNFQIIYGGVEAEGKTA